MLPFFVEPETRIPSDSTIRVLHIENRHDLLVHAASLDDRA